LEKIAEEYHRSVDAGASIVHLHGPYTVDEKIQTDGTKLSDLDIPGWLRLKELIEEKCRPIIQYGIANGRFPQRVTLMDQHPDMMSICFNAHDECFQPDPNYPPVELYGLHNREELTEYAKLTLEKQIKPEVESFHFGAIWNATRLIQKGLLKKPIWTTLFLGWQGGCWTPPTPKALIYMVDHLPAGFNWNVSVMDPPTQTAILTLAIILGGHVRVGMEDNPYVTDRQFAKSNAELVAKIVRIAKELGRQVAGPAEARQIIGLNKQ
jgi:3-keto-5-aminohexanoate cleavage enzyme